LSVADPNPQIGDTCYATDVSPCPVGQTAAFSGTAGLDALVYAGSGVWKCGGADANHDIAVAAQNGTGTVTLTCNPNLQFEWNSVSVTGAPVYSLPSSGCSNLHEFFFHFYRTSGTGQPSFISSATNGVQGAGCGTLGNTAGNILDIGMQWDSANAEWIGHCGGTLPNSGSSSGGAPLTHQVTTSANGQTITAACDTTYPVTEWDILASHSFTAPTIKVGGSCAQGQILKLVLMQDTTGGITPTVTGDTGVTVNYQANGGTQPTITTSANARDWWTFSDNTYPSGDNLVLTNFLPTTPTVLAAAQTCTPPQVLDAVDPTGASANCVTPQSYLTLCSYIGGIGSTANLFGAGYVPQSAHLVRVLVNNATGAPSCTTPPTLVVEDCGTSFSSTKCSGAALESLPLTTGTANQWDSGALSVATTGSADFIQFQESATVSCSTNFSNATACAEFSIP
jgi:hypothetical protein